MFIKPKKTTEMYIAEIIWFLSWPVMMWVAYKLSFAAIKKFDELVK